MKKLIYFLFTTTLFLGFLFTSCDKDKKEARVIGSNLNIKSISIDMIFAPYSNGIVIGSGLNYSTQPGVGWSQQFSGIYTTAYCIVSENSDYITTNGSREVIVDVPEDCIIEVWDLDYADKTFRVIATNFGNPGSPMIFAAQPNHRYGGYAWYSTNAQKDLAIMANWWYEKPESEWVEINGVKWAKCNVDMPGTFAAKPEAAGMFYQWNRKTGWSSTDPMINSNGGTTWDSSIPTGICWEKANDPCPTGWRVPTKEEFESLIASGSHWTTENGVVGRIFGSEDKKVFFPAAGYRYGSSGSAIVMGYISACWSSTLYTDFGEDAFSMSFTDGDAVISTYYSRNYGFPMRCVAE